MKKDNIQMNLMKIGYEDDKWNWVQRQGLLSTVPRLWVL
jgi:hypothetical protein